jgi:hypothetical protein
MGVVVNVSYRGDASGGGGFTSSRFHAESNDGSPQAAMLTKLRAAVHVLGF